MTHPHPLDPNPMTVTTSQGDVVIDITTFGTPPWLELVKRVGIRISGGADSAILAYMLAVYKRDYKPDMSIHPITCINDRKPYQEIFAKQVLAKITDLTGVEFDEHFVENVNGDQYREDQGIFQESLYKTKKINIHFMGETLNPPIGVEADWRFLGNGRDPTRNEKGATHVPVVIYKPFRNIDKKAIAELYQHYGVLDTLFPLTRSCEIHTFDFSNHCGHCWFCLERNWGFGRYV